MTLGANLNGTVIARNIDVQAESHRTDLMMFSVDPGGNTLEIPVGKDWQSDETFEVEAVLIRIDVQGRQTECASLRLNESNRWRGTFEEVEKERRRWQRIRLSGEGTRRERHAWRRRRAGLRRGDLQRIHPGHAADGFLITNRRPGRHARREKAQRFRRKARDAAPAGLAPIL